MIDLTVIIITYNEEMHLKRCISSLQSRARKVIVVDSFSTDKTCAIAQEYGAELFQREFVNHADQFNWALKSIQISTEWVLKLDADEYLEPALLEEIELATRTISKNITGILLRRRQTFLRVPIRFGMRKELHLLRMWRTGAAIIENRWMDEHAILLSGKSITLKNIFWDDNAKGLNDFIEKHCRYAVREAVEVLYSQRFPINSATTGPTKNNVDYSFKRDFFRNFYYRMPQFIGPFLYFILRYFLFLGFLDGRYGLMYHVLQGFWYRLQTELTIREFAAELSSKRSDEEFCVELSRLSKLRIRPPSLDCERVI